MLINNQHYRTIWYDPKEQSVKIIDQQKLPFNFTIQSLTSLDSACFAIAQMQVRGAGLIGATAGFAYYLASLEAPKNNLISYEKFMAEASAKIFQTRPTASNLALALQKQEMASRKTTDISEKTVIALKCAQEIADQDANFCQQIGEYGLEIIEKLAQSKKRKLRILTHCNAGWLAFVDFGSALAPIYAAFNQGIELEVLVDETRPRNQGASLTAFELAEQKVPHKLIVDNVGGHLMQHGLVDMVITGADRVSRRGDAANKIGTYLKALAAFDNQVPFYIALPSTTFDFTIHDGVKEIPIEERASSEVRFMQGKDEDGQIRTIQICPDQTESLNYAFDVTPNRLITGLITERGLCKANEEDILRLFPEAK